jgi:hypothetical protein
MRGESIKLAAEALIDICGEILGESLILASVVATIFLVKASLFDQWS